MSHNKSTLRLDVRVSAAEEALDRIVHSANWDRSLNESVNTIQLVLKVCEHKMLRLEELETEIGKIRAAISVQELRKGTDLAAHCAELQAELERAKSKIEQLESIEQLSAELTGTDF